MRAPALIEREDPVPGPGPDEAASDPSSSAVHSSSGDALSMSMGGPPSSEELLPDSAMLDALVNKVNAEGDCFTRRVQEDQPCGHEPEVIPETEMDLVELEAPSCKSEPVVDDEAQQATEAWSSRRYEDGPPNLSPEELLKLDLAMDKLEIRRLLSLGVLRKIGHRADGGASLSTGKDAEMWLSGDGDSPRMSNKWRGAWLSSVGSGLASSVDREPGTE